MSEYDAEPASPYLVTLACPENAPATIILPHGQHYTRAIDPATGALDASVQVWDHDVDAMKAAGFRDPSELAAAQDVHASFWAEPGAQEQAAQGHEGLAPPADQAPLEQPADQAGGEAAQEAAAEPDAEAEAEAEAESVSEQAHAEEAPAADQGTAKRTRKA